MMKNSWKKKTAITIGVILIVILILNFGLNLWLKYQLPSYVKNNTDYKVNYDKMDVDVTTGNIHITDLKVSTNNPNDLDVLALKGSIADLQIGRIGIWSALFKKEIAPSTIRLEKPDLEIRLANKKKKAKKKSKMSFDFDDLEILDGNIKVFNTRNSKMAALSNFSITLNGFSKLENPKSGEIPFEFDEFKMNGKDVFVRPTEDQLITAKSIVSKDQGLDIQQFKLTPLLTQKQFQRYYPKKKQQIKFEADAIFVSNVVVKSKKITLDNLTMKSPDITFFKGRSAEAKEQKSIELSLGMDKVDLQNSAVKVIDANGLTKFLVSGLTVKADKFVFDDKSAKEKIPFRYDVLVATGNDVVVDTDTQAFRISSLKLTPKEGEIVNLTAKTTQEVQDKASLNFTANSFLYKINEWSFVESKLKLDVKEIIVKGLNGSAKAPIKTIKKVAQESGMYNPVKIGKIQLLNSNFSYVKNNQPLSVKNLNVNLGNVEISQKKNKTGNDIKVGNYDVKVSNLNYSTKFYDFVMGNVVATSTKIAVSNFNMKPRYSRSQFIRMIPVEQDLYSITIPSITLDGSWDFFSDQKFIKGNQLTISGMNANIFRSKVPADDPKIKPMYSELLRKIDLPLRIATTSIRNSRLVYEEDTEKSNGPGKLMFGNFNMTISNLNSNKEKGASTKIPIKINCSFMDVSPMAVDWTIDTASMNDAFGISGTISSLPANHINAFIEPYLKVRASGSIQSLAFNLNGDKRGIQGSMKMKHQDLKVSILNKDGEKKKLLSSIANVFVKSNSKKIPESVEISKVERDPTKSFFNMFWKGIQEGLKKTLI